VDFASQIVPALVVLVANLMSGKHGSQRYEKVTAIFGWLTVLSLALWLMLRMFLGARVTSQYVFQLAAFSLITALSRDYEKWLRPLFPWNR
jgi:hypothetical protein